MPHINVRDLGRIKEIVAVLVRHGFGQLVRSAGLEVQGEPIETSLPLARRLRMVLEDLGPTFIKIGQVLSVRPDIVPKEIMEEFSLLQDKVSPESFERVRKVVEEALGADIKDHFTVFESEPIASASIAQVHAAILPNGEEVAVKVQRPGIETAIRSDLHILYTMAHLVTGRLKLPIMYTPVGIVREFDEALNRELDFLQEARAAQQFRRNFENSETVSAPKIHVELSTRQVMVMERIDGTSFRGRMDAKGTQKLSLEESRRLMHVVMEATYQQVLVHGLFHGDPHPGNLMVNTAGQVVYLDFGLTGRITREMQDTLVTIFTGLVFADPDSVAMTLVRVGATAQEVDYTAFRNEIGRLMSKYHGASLEELSDVGTLAELIAVASRHGIRLVPEYAVLARTMSLIDGLARMLIPNVDIVAEVRPYAMKMIGQRLSPEKLGSDAFRTLQHAQAAFTDVPIQLNQLLTDLKRGNVRVMTRDPGHQQLAQVIRFSTLRLTIGICASACVLSGAFLMTQWSPSIQGVPIVFVLGVSGVLVGLMLVMGLMVHVLVAERIHPREIRKGIVAFIRFFLARSGS